MKKIIVLIIALFLVAPLAMAKETFYSALESKESVEAEGGAVDGGVFAAGAAGNDEQHHERDDDDVVPETPDPRQGQDERHHNTVSDDGGPVQGGARRERLDERVAEEGEVDCGKQSPEGTSRVEIVSAQIEPLGRVIIRNRGRRTPLE